MLMGPNHLARITSFLSTRFSLYRTGSGRFEIQPLQKFLRVRIVVCVLSAAIPSPSLAHAQSQTSAVFRFSKEVHWGDTVLPPGDYVITSLSVKNTGGMLTFATPNSQSRSPNSATRDLSRQGVVSGDSPSAER